MAPDSCLWLWGASINKFTLRWLSESHEIFICVTYVQAMERAGRCGTDLQAHLEPKPRIILETRGDQPKLVGSRSDVSAQPSILFRFISYRISPDHTHISRLPSKPPHDSMTCSPNTLSKRPSFFRTLTPRMVPSPWVRSSSAFVSHIMSTWGNDSMCSKSLRIMAYPPPYL